MGDSGDTGLKKEGEIVLQVPVFDDAVRANMLDVEGDEIDRLTLARDAVERAAEVSGEMQPNCQLVARGIRVEEPGDVRATPCRLRWPILTGPSWSTSWWTATP